MILPAPTGFWRDGAAGTGRWRSALTVVAAVYGTTGPMVLRVRLCSRLDPQWLKRRRGYQINIFCSAGDGYWVAVVPDVHFCSAFGASPEAAVREIQVAVQAWLASARVHGDAIPEPPLLPGHLRGASGSVRGNG
jgi:predicted RNase H-like HicB family nuclease